MKFLRVFVLFFLSMSCLYGQDVDKRILALSCRDGVYSYNKYYKDAVKSITRQHAYDLLDDFYSHTTEHQFQNEFRNQVEPLLNKNNAEVYVNCGKSVGFITYSDWYPPHYALLGLPEKKGQVCHLAVDSLYQKSGFGKLLMESALDSFRKKSVSSVRLVKLHDFGSLDRFYNKCGFKVIRTTKTFATLYILRLGQNPFLKAFKRLFGYD